MSLNYCTKKKNKKLCIKKSKDIDLLSDTQNKIYDSYWRGKQNIGSKAFIYLVNHPDVKDNVCYAGTINTNTDRFKKDGSSMDYFSVIFDIKKNEITFPKLINYGWLDYDELPEKYPDFKIPSDIKKKDEEFLFYLIKSCKKRFFALPLSIYWKTDKGHSNILIYDTKNKEMEYFEPYGDIHQKLIDSNKPNTSERLKKMESAFIKYCKKYIGDFKYFPTLSFCPRTSFQKLNIDFGIKIEGENYRYCMAWSLWYLHLRLKNISTDRKTLIDKALEELNKDKKGFRKFIRNYSQFLLKNLEETPKKKICSPGKILNQKTNRCIKKKESETKTKKVCPPGKVLNEKTNRCIKKKATETKTKKVCPPGKILNEKTNRCIIKREPKIKTKKLKIVEPKPIPSKSPKKEENLFLLSNNKNNISSFKTNWIGNPQQIIDSFLFLVNKPEFKDKVCHSVKSKYTSNDWNSFAVIFDISYKNSKDGILFFPDYDDLTISLKEVRNVFYRKINNCKKQFYAIPMIIKLTNKTVHFNIIIIDMKKEEVEFFEPYGEIPSTSENILKIRKLSDTFVKGLHDYGDVISSKVKLIPTTSFCPQRSFQVRNEDYGSIRTDDPKGFCGAWGMWYLHMRLKYSDLDKKDLVDKALEELDKNKKGYRTFIRNYSQFLLKNIGKTTKKCPPGKVLNEKTNRCIKKPISKKKLK